MNFLLKRALSLLAKGLVLLYEAMGIEGILALILLVELGGFFTYHEMTKRDYIYIENYEMKEDAQVVSVEPDDIIFEEQGIESHFDEKYFLISLTMENKNSEKLTEPFLEAKNQNGDFISSYRIDYYGTGNGLAGDCDSVIPGGTSKVSQYLIAMDESVQQETTEVTLFDWREEGQPERVITVALP